MSNQIQLNRDMRNHMFLGIFVVITYLIYIIWCDMYVTERDWEKITMKWLYIYFALPLFYQLYVCVCVFLEAEL